jgi:hypothetical protein
MGRGMVTDEHATGSRGSEHAATGATGQAHAGSGDGGDKPPGMRHRACATGHAANSQAPPGSDAAIGPAPPARRSWASERAWGGLGRRGGGSVRAAVVPSSLLCRTAPQQEDQPVTARREALDDGVSKRLPAALGVRLALAGAHAEDGVEEQHALR